MNENEMVQDDEISLFDLWERLRAGWRYVAGGTAIGLLGRWPESAFPRIFEAPAGWCKNPP